MPCFEQKIKPRCFVYNPSYITTSYNPLYQVANITYNPRGFSGYFANLLVPQLITLDESDGRERAL